MHCESGDILVRDVPVYDRGRRRPAIPGDGHAMANNYNAVPRRGGRRKDGDAWARRRRETG